MMIHIVNHVPRVRHARAWVRGMSVALALSLAALPAAAQAGASTGEHTAVINGARLWYRVAGSGSVPVVFVPGGPGRNSYDFAAVQGPRLERRLKMVYFDPRGTGRSERPASGDYAIATMVEDIEGLRRELGAPRIALIGHSFGALMALEYAAKYPQRVSRIVYADGLWDTRLQCRARRDRLIASFPALRERILSDTLDEQGKRRSDCELEFRVLNGKDREAFNDAGVFRDSVSKARLEGLDRASALSNTGEMSRALFRAGLLEYRFTRLDRLTMPVQVIVGRYDAVGGMEPQRILARRLPNARFVEFPESGHFTYLDEPDRFAHEVTNFLTGTRRP
ncbi:MAG TPA: alpha/beta hydrolase [Longimicrobium sp.]|jgi:proline iminopeptidase